MKVKDIVDALNLKVLAGGDGLDREVKGVYTCDLLSWVMSHGKQNNAWITVQIHPNIIAVATLLEFSCVIIPENIEVEEATLNKANDEKIPVLQSNLNAYEICIELNKLGV
ncbi:DRTGG domain-containing protein [Caloramator proteoclasticus]|uniref:DRTGG domain-containing protein n=1 Tax=Caloramator proteoclasticus DSM 10124 TaxID=1121262 RepID=A0A1M4XTP7_9CLOT|nr:DRTGG domain-containing protein [Caloramator proteoclasticus]SHE96612.1 DRTGG domain-containing protein [Caloramator proteoclasticus DSM 10124]